VNDILSESLNVGDKVVFKRKFDYGETQALITNIDSVGNVYVKSSLGICTACKLEDIVSIVKD
jgi:hypothetical protein